MNATTQPNSPKTAARGFDDARQAQVLALIRLGCSRRMAAEMTQCSHTTITRAALRDSHFAQQLADAESHVDVASLARIQEAAAENKNWRAAAWMLERRHPEEFGRRAAHTFGGDQIMSLLAKVFTYTLPRVPKEQQQNFLEDFSGTLHEVESQMRQPDRWREMAGKDRDHPSEHAAQQYRSPYEHPLWDDPNSFDELWQHYPKDETKQTDWIKRLNYRDFETFRHGLRARIAHYREHRPKMVNDARELRREDEALAAIEEHEEDAMQKQPRADADGSASLPVAAADAKEAVVTQDVASRAGAEQATGDRDADDRIAGERSAPDRVPSKAPLLEDEGPADLPAAVPQAACADFTQPRTTPPSAATHQAYQQWLVEHLVVLRHNLLPAHALQQQAMAAPAAPDQASGAYEAQLIKWTEALAK